MNAPPSPSTGSVAVPATPGAPCVLVASADPAVHQQARVALADVATLTHVHSPRGVAPALETHAPSVVIVDDALPEVDAVLARAGGRARVVLVTESGAPRRQAATRVPRNAETRLRDAVTHALRLSAMSAGVGDLLSASGVFRAATDIER